MPCAVEVPKYEMHEEIQVEPSRTALSIVGMRNYFVKEGASLLVSDAERTIPAIRGLLSPKHVREGSWGWEIVEGLRPLEGELVIRKVLYDAFYRHTWTTSCGSGARRPSSSAERSPTSASTTPPRAPPCAGTRW